MRPGFSLVSAGFSRVETAGERRQILSNGQGCRVAVATGGVSYAGDG